MLDDISFLPLTILFLLAAAAIGWAGTKLAGIADELADRTGMGEIIAGALFVGASTSLPGLVSSLSTAWEGYAGIAIGNALGGLTVQTAFLVVADLMYRRSNLEHAAASVAGLAQATILVSLIAIPLLASLGPDMTIAHVHPASIALFALYGAALRLLANIREHPMWVPVETSESVNDDAGEDGVSAMDIDEEDASQVCARRTEQPSNQQSDPTGDQNPTSNRYADYSDRRLWSEFAVCVCVTAIAGFVVGEASIAMVEQTGMAEDAFGTIFTAFANSLPELVTAIAAVRIGAVNLAVGDIIGGNAFEVLFIGAADLVYLPGSLYAQFSTGNLFTAVTAILMVGVLLLGLLGRQRSGPAGIGWESVVVLLLYVGSIVVLFQ